MLDPPLRKQLEDARKKIVAQLDELEFRVTGTKGAWRPRRPQDAGDVYDALKQELREVDELLANNDEEE